MLACQKHLFSLPENSHYLNCAYMSPIPRRVEEEGLAAIRQKAKPQGIGPEDFFRASDEVRTLFARLTHIADPQHVALIPAASYGLATVARNTSLRRGDKIVVVHEQFPSNIYTWHRLAEAKGGRVHVVLPPDGVEDRGAKWNERILDAIDVHTSVVALPHVHWADGTRFDLARIGVRAREIGAALVIDGTQSVGALPFDVRALQPDALICAGYKWLLGPYSLGVAYLGPRYECGVPLEENWIARKNSEDFAGLVQYEDAYQPGALRFDVGERSNFILAPMLVAGLKYLVDWGVESIQNYCERLTHDALAEVQSLGYLFESPEWCAAHLFGVRLPPGLSVAHLHEALKIRDISVSIRGNAVRISPHVYNDEGDMAALISAFSDGCRAETRKHYSLPI